MNDSFHRVLVFHHLSLWPSVIACITAVVAFILCYVALRRAIRGRMIPIVASLIVSLSMNGLWLFETACTEANSDLRALEALRAARGSQLTLKQHNGAKVYEVIVPGGPAPANTYIGSVVVREMSPVLIRDFDESLLLELQRECPDVFEFIFLSKISGMRPGERITL
jgi:hypothetical protein